MEPLDKALTIRAALPAPIGTILQPVSRWRRRLMSALGLGRFKTFRQKRFKLRETVNEPFFDFDYARIAAISG